MGSHDDKVCVLGARGPDHAVGRDTIVDVVFTKS